MIEDLALEFGPGMTALTGETGAGKTLVVEALQLVLGGRANPGLVRAGAAEALVEARFVVGGGRRRTRGDPRPLGSRRGAVAGLGGRPHGPGSARWARRRRELVEIHGQHEHRALVAAAAQRNVLDAFAGTDLSRVRALRSQLARARRRPGRARRRPAAACPRGRRPALPGRRDRGRPPRGSRGGDRAAPAGGPPGRRGRLPGGARARRGGADRPLRGRRRRPRPAGSRRRRAVRARGLRRLPRAVGRGGGRTDRRGPVAARRGRGVGGRPAAAWSRCRSGGGCWPSSGASTARTWVP